MAKKITREEAIIRLKEAGTSSKWLPLLNKSILLPKDIEVVMNALQTLYGNAAEHAISFIKDLYDRGFTLTVKQKVHVMFSTISYTKSQIRECSALMNLANSEFIEKLLEHQYSSSYMKGVMIQALTQEMDEHEIYKIAMRQNDPEYAAIVISPMKTIKLGSLRHVAFMNISTDVQSISDNIHMLPIPILLEDVGNSALTLIKSMHYWEIDENNIPSGVADIIGQMTVSEIKRIQNNSDLEFCKKYLDKVLSGNVLYQLATGSEIDYHEVDLDNMSYDSRIELFMRKDVPAWFCNMNTGVLMQVLMVSDPRFTAFCHFRNEEGFFL